MQTNELQDRELLTLAAKAAGIKLADEVDSYIPGSRAMWAVGPGGRDAVWTPLTDDSDFLRLAAALCMNFRWDFVDLELRASCIEQGRLGHRCSGQEAEFFEKYTSDESGSAAVYRRAGVRLAALIGKAMS